MHNPFLNLEDMTMGELQERILKLSEQIATATVYEMNEQTIIQMKNILECYYEEVYNRESIKRFNKEKENYTVFDVEKYLDKNRKTSEESNENSRKQNYKPGW